MKPTKRDRDKARAAYRAYLAKKPRVPNDFGVMCRNLFMAGYMAGKRARR